MAKSVFGLIGGLFNVLSTAVFVVPAMVVAGAVLWLIVSSIFGLNKSDGTDYLVTDESCGVPDIAPGHVVRATTRKDGAVTVELSCTRQYMPGHWGKTSGDYWNCEADGMQGTRDTIPDPDSWGFNRPRLAICRVSMPVPKR